MKKNTNSSPNAPAKTVAYLRMSTPKQDMEKDKVDILKLANDIKLGHVHFVSEYISGKSCWRERKIGRLIDELNPGDCIITSEMSRLGRSMLECIEILSVALRNGLHVYDVRIGWRLEDTMQSAMIAMGLSMAAEIERRLIVARTKEALRVKKAAGMRLGRPPGPGKSRLDPYRPEIEALLANGSTKRFVARRYGTSASNLHLWLRQRGLGKKPLENNSEKGIHASAS